MSRSHKCNYRRGAPKWYVRMYNRRFRHQTKAAIHHQRDVPVRPEDAQWHWW